MQSEAKVISQRCTRDEIRGLLLLLLVLLLFAAATSVQVNLSVNLSVRIQRGVCIDHLGPFCPDTAAWLALALAFAASSPQSSASAADMMGPWRAALLHPNAL